MSLFTSGSNTSEKDRSKVTSFKNGHHFLVLLFIPKGREYWILTVKK
jgi:hypothetical protein